MVNRLVNGILIIIIGIVLLMNTTGNLPWSVWEALVEYWPLIIIGLGIQVVFSRWRIPGVALALILALLLSALYPFPGSPDWPTRMSFRERGTSKPLQYSKQLEVPLDSEVSRLEVRMVARSLDVQARGDQALSVQDSEHAILGELEWDRYEPLVEIVPRYEGSAVRTTIESRVKEGRDAGKQRWDLLFHPSLSTGIDVTAGAADLRFDLTSFFAKNLIVSAGVANVEIDFGLSGQHSTVAIAAGVANVELFVPESAGLRVSVSAPPFITRVRVDDLGLVKQGNSWVSEGYSTAGTKIEVNISCGAGSVSIKKSP